MRPAQPAPKDGPRINEEIRVREVHLIDKDGTNRGTVPIADALRLAQEAGLDLVEISPNAVPPIVAAMSNSSVAVARASTEPTATGFGDQPPRSPSTLLL